jgi:tRNA threonylcarbamoyladenosine biosynthesis protein TsaE
MKFVLADAIATQSLGFKFGEFLPAGSVILLSGDLGAGKTTFVQGIGAGLGINDAIVSPTFTLINEYTEGRIPLYHLDLYRLQGNEVSGLNLESYWEGLEMTPGIVAIEWAERLPYKPDSYLEVRLMYANNSGNDGEIREVEIIPVNLINITDFLNKSAI